MTSESAVERIPISLGIYSSFQAIIQGDALLTYDVGEEVLRPARWKLSIPFSPTIFSQTEDVTKRARGNFEVLVENCRWRRNGDYSILDM